MRFVTRALKAVSSVAKGVQVVLLAVAGGPATLITAYATGRYGWNQGPKFPGPQKWDHFVPSANWLKI